MTLTADQIIAIIMLLQAFGVSQTTIDQVRTEITPASLFGAVTDTVPVAQNPISINTFMLGYQYQRLYPKGVHGLIGLWIDGLVRQNRMDISKGSDIIFSIDGASLGSPEGTDGDYSFGLDTTLYPDGEHVIEIDADDGLGNTASASTTITINNYGR